MVEYEYNGKRYAWEGTPQACHAYVKRLSRSYLFAAVIKRDGTQVWYRNGERWN